jgi:hypothetical protein
MRAKNLAILDRITLDDLERALDKHTREKVPVDRWTAFSWSVSRHQMFTRCKRQYYLNYYGARRVREANSQVVSAVWWLKQVTSLRAWVGSVLHHAAGLAVNAYREGHKITPEDLASQARQYFHDGASASSRGAKHDRQWVVLFEHIYPDDPPSLDWHTAEKLVVDLTHVMLESDAYNFITSLPRHAVYEVDEPFQSFQLPGVPLLGDVRVFAIPDVLLHDGETIHIIDWKTGDVERPEIRDQAGIYRLYAHQRYDLPGEQVEVSFSALDSGGISVEAPGGTPSIEEARALAHASMRAMVEHMSDFEYNTVMIDDFPMTDDRSICRRCGFKRACWRHEETYE